MSPLGHSNISGCFKNQVLIKFYRFLLSLAITNVQIYFQEKVEESLSPKDLLQLPLSVTNQRAIYKLLYGMRFCFLNISVDLLSCTTSCILILLVWFLLNVMVTKAKLPMIILWFIEIFFVEPQETVPEDKPISTNKSYTIFEP